MDAIQWHDTHAPPEEGVVVAREQMHRLRRKIEGREEKNVEKDEEYNSFV